ncbi:MAG TPA: hypothetical protein VNL14_19735 [Candidatus Acidoferrales bacterium]|nr:hypothetical protein [Candidatus Acidoferrales bacterium]
MARAYLNPEALQIVAVGDGRKIRPILERFAPVEVYDTEGRVVRRSGSKELLEP